MAFRRLSYFTALAVGLVLTVEAWGQQPPPMARCTAADRASPTLSKTVFPAAQFQMVDEPLRSGPQTGAILRHGVEKLKLADGTELEVNLTGCDHHGNAYRFRIPKDETPTTQTKYWLDKAIALVGQIEKGNIDSMVDLQALNRALQSRAADPKARPFANGSLDGVILRGGAEERGRIQELYLVTINQNAPATTVVSVSYLIGPL